MPVDPLQQRDQVGLDWHGGRLGQTGVPQTAGFGGAADERAFPEARSRKKLGLYNAKDLEGFIAPYADEIELRLLATGETLARGADFLRATYGERFSQATDLQAETVGRIVVSDLVANRERLTDGRGDRSESIDVYHVVDGRIRLVWFVIPR